MTARFKFNYLFANGERKIVKLWKENPMPVYLTMLLIH